MTPQDLAFIEEKLEISLPVAYRELMLNRSKELRAAYRRGLNGTPYALELKASEVVDTNLCERNPESGAAEAVPDWWTRYVLIGTDGGGDYCCLRLDGQPGVWVIGSDLPEQEEMIHASLAEFVEISLAS